jgi:thioredoxin reductase
VELDGGETCTARKLVLATGVTDALPPVDGIDAFYGRSVHHCPYCDGWEHRDQPMAVYGRGKPAAGLAMSLKTWTPDVVLCTDGPSGLPGAHRRELAALGISVRTQKITRLEGDDGDLRRIHFAAGEAIDCRAIFFNTGQHQSCGLAGQFKCELTKRGTIQTDRWERTSMPGLYAVGDCSRNVQWVVVAAAQGAIAAEAINKELQKEDRDSFLALRGA